MTMTTAALRVQILSALKARTEATLKQIAQATTERNTPSRVTNELNKMRADALVECAAMTTVIVYGPQACGKTRNSEALKRHFGCNCIVDDWNGRAALRDGDLALTNAFIERKPNGAHLVSFDDAMRQMRSA